MIDHVWSILCLRSIVDARTNNVSLIDVLEVLSVAQPINSPGLIPQTMEFVSVWERADYSVPDRGRARLTVLDPQGKLIGESLTYDIDLTDKPKLRNITTFEGFPVTSTGRYGIVVEIYQEENQQWHTVSRTSLLVQSGGIESPLE
jgi:hypothetical protein